MHLHQRLSENLEIDQVIVTLRADGREDGEESNLQIANRRSNS